MSAARPGSASEDDRLPMVFHSLKKTGWVQPADYAGQVNTVAMSVAAQTTGGKCLLVQVGAKAVVANDDLRKQGTAKQQAALRNAKLDQAVFSLMDFVQQMTRKRQGYAGHRGYFKVVAVKELATQQETAGNVEAWHE